MISRNVSVVNLHTLILKCLPLQFSHTPSTLNPSIASLLYPSHHSHLLLHAPPPPLPCLFYLYCKPTI